MQQLPFEPFPHRLSHFHAHTLLEVLDATQGVVPCPVSGTCVRGQAGLHDPVRDPWVSSPFFLCEIRGV